MFIRALSCKTFTQACYLMLRWTPELFLLDTNREDEEQKMLWLAEDDHNSMLTKGLTSEILWFLKLFQNRVLSTLPLGSFTSLVETIMFHIHKI